MPLNPFRDALSQTGLSAFRHESPFKAEADQALQRLREFRVDLERQVRRGDLTLKVARERAQAAAEMLRVELSRQAEGYSPTPRMFLDRLVEAGNARKKAREHMSIEGLQRETNRLLRQSIVEQQLQTRSAEFEARAFVRGKPGSHPAPTLDSLLAFHRTASDAGDEAAAEWTRRQLEAMRRQIADPAAQRLIDVACDRPDSVNPRIVASYVDTLQGGACDALELFVDNALEARDANACVAAFLLARDEPGSTGVRWVRKLLNGLGAFPDAALSTLRTIEADARSTDAEAARAQAEYAVAQAEAHAKLADLAPPSDEEIHRAERLRAKPVAKLGEPIGLTLQRRGAFPDEIPADEPPVDEFA